MSNNFFIGRCEIDLLVENCRSLKDKRRIIKSLKDRLRRTFNVSVCEYGDQSLWQRCQLGLSVCSNERTLIEATVMKMISFIERTHGIELLHYVTDVQ